LSFQCKGQLHHRGASHLPCHAAPHRASQGPRYAFLGFTGVWYGNEEESLNDLVDASSRSQLLLIYFRFISIFSLCVHALFMCLASVGWVRTGRVIHATFEQVFMLCFCFFVLGANGRGCPLCIRFVFLFVAIWYCSRHVGVHDVPSLASIRVLRAELELFSLLNVLALLVLLLHASCLKSIIVVYSSFRAKSHPSARRGCVRERGVNGAGGRGATRVCLQDVSCRCATWVWLLCVAHGAGGGSGVAHTLQNT